MAEAQTPKQQPEDEALEMVDEAVPSYTGVTGEEENESYILPPTILIETNAV